MPFASWNQFADVADYLMGWLTLSGHFAHGGVLSVMAMFHQSPSHQWPNGGQNLVPATAAPETPDAIESEIEGTKHDFIRGIGSHRNSDAL
jgi:hypothetical protein